VATNLGSMAILAIIIFWSTVSIPILGIILIISGYILRKETNNNLRIVGKISLFSVIALIIISIIFLSFVMPWSGTIDTNTTSKANIK